MPCTGFLFRGRNVRNIKKIYIGKLSGNSKKNELPRCNLRIHLGRFSWMCAWLSGKSMKLDFQNYRINTETGPLSQSVVCMVIFRLRFFFVWLRVDAKILQAQTTRIYEGVSAAECITMLTGFACTRVKIQNANEHLEDWVNEWILYLPSDCRVALW